MIKTTIILAVLGLVAGVTILRAVRAMQRQIAADAAENDDWTGARHFGGRFPGDAAPAEAEIRKSWTPVRASTASALAKPGAEGPSAPLSETQLRKYVKWCDSRCKAGWLIVLPTAGAATLWFQDQQDAQNFARIWHPLAGT